jgi:hypothetical protein
MLIAGSPAMLYLSELTAQVVRQPVSDFLPEQLIL